MTIKTFPDGVMLCRPKTPGPRCQNCRRWVDHPEQVIGQITRVVNVSSQRDPACIHIPISSLERAK